MTSLSSVNVLYIFGSLSTASLMLIEPTEGHECNGPAWSGMVFNPQHWNTHKFVKVLTL